MAAHEMLQSDTCYKYYYITAALYDAHSSEQHNHSATPGHGKLMFNYWRITCVNHLQFSKCNLKLMEAIFDFVQESVIQGHHFQMGKISSGKSLH